MISFGFYDSKNHDRTYSAKEFNELFDGVIRQGVFMSIGKCFTVAPKNGMTITVDTGKAWLNKSWIVNNALFPITLDPSDVILNRYDAIVLDIDQRVDHRRNDIKVVKGTPGSNPTKPTMIPNDDDYDSANPEHFIYPLAYVYIKAGATSIRLADIENVVGTSELPYVTGILETVSIDSLKNQWMDEWDAFYESQTHKMETDYDKWTAEWDDWYNNQTAEIQNAYNTWQKEWEVWTTNYTNEMNATAKEWEDLWKTWFYSYVNENQNANTMWQKERDTEFRNWFTSLTVLLEDDVATNLANEILENSTKISEVEGVVSDLVNDNTYHGDVLDGEASPVLDGKGDSIIGQDKVFLTTDSEIPKVIELPDDSDIIVKTDNQIKGYPSVNLLTQYINPLERAVLNHQDNINQLTKDVSILTSDGIYDWLDSWIPVSSRKNIWRGKNLGPVFTDEQKAVIRDSSFRGMFIGDYWTYHNTRSDEIGKSCPEWVNFRLADFDHYKQSGRPSGLGRVTKSHITIVPDGSMGEHTFSKDKKYNVPYLSSFLTSKEGFNTLIGPIINDFGVADSNVLVYEDRYTSQIDTSGESPKIYSKYASHWIDLLSEIEIFGYKRLSKSPDYEFAPSQLSLFRLDPTFVAFNGDYILRDISEIDVNPSNDTENLSKAITSIFVSTYYTSPSPSNTQSHILAIRPVFSIIG